MAGSTSAGARQRSPMSESHKAALAQGREEGRTVRRYLEVLKAQTGKRNRRRTEADIQQRLAAIEAELPTAAPILRLRLVQERIDLQNELAADDPGESLEALESAFVACAGGYSQRKGISYAAWREIGVPAGVLRRAGIVRLSGDN